MFYLKLSVSAVLAIAIGMPLLNGFEVDKRQECIDCRSQTEGPDVLHQVNTLRVLDNGVTVIKHNAIYYTESGRPVRLVDENGLTSQDHRIRFERLVDEFGNSVIADGFVAVPFIDSELERVTRHTAHRSASLSDFRPASSTAIDLQPSQDSFSLSEPSYADNPIESASSNVLVHREEAAKLADRPTSRSLQEPQVSKPKFEPYVVTSSIRDIRDDARSKPKENLFKKVGLSALALAAGFYASNDSQSDSLTRVQSSASKQGLSFKSADQSSEASDSMGSEDEPSSSESEEGSSANEATTAQLINLTNNVGDLSSEVQTLNNTVTTVQSDLTQVQSGLSDVSQQVGAIQGQIGETDVVALAEQVNVLERKAYQGIASAAALVTAVPNEPGKTIVNLGVGTFEGEQSLGLSVSRRLKKYNGYIYSGVATGVSDTDSKLIKAGVGFEF